MAHELSDIPLETACVEHYLFDLGYPIEKVSEIFDMNENLVQGIYDNYSKYTLPTGGIK